MYTLLLAILHKQMSRNAWVTIGELTTAVLCIKNTLKLFIYLFFAEHTQWAVAFVI